jgi:hypothetical protein
MHEVSVASKAQKKVNQTLPGKPNRKEKGKTPSLSHLGRICRHRAVKVDYPLAWSEMNGLLEAVEALEREPERSPAGAVLVDDDSAA